MCVMERVYLLLRENQQTGPFTIGELLQQQLRSTDMIWIEGKSTAWTYLSELELDVHVPEKNDTTPGPVKAKDEIEQKAEELRQKVLTFPSRAFDPRRPVEIESYGPAPAEEDEIEFVDHRQRRKARQNLVVTETLLTCVVIGLFITGIYKGPSFLATKKRVNEAAAVKLNTGDDHAAHKAVVQPTTIAVAPPDTIQQNTDSLGLLANTRMIIGKKTHSDSSTVKMLPADDSSRAQPLAKQAEPEPKIDTPVTVFKKQDTQATKKEPAPAVTQDNAKPETAKDEGKDEKKGFLRGLFKKKKKHDGE